MRKYPLVIGALALAGLSGSILLVSRPQEQALLHLRDGQFDEAQRAYESQGSQGRIDVAVASQLAHMHLQNGEVEQAIDVMEKFVAEHPDNLIARKELGSFYQYAQRTDDYIRNLEEIARRRPDRETLERLADIYSFNAQSDKNLETLQKLVALGPEASPKYYLGLAQLQAAQGKRIEAIETLMSLKKTHPEAYGFEETRLLVSLLLDEQRGEEAAQIATTWRDKTQDMAQVAALANLLHYKGSPEMGLKLLEIYQGEIDKSPEILREYSLLLMDTGRGEEAFTHLYDLYKGGKLPAELHPLLLMLASMHGDEPLLEELASKINLRNLTQADLTSLSELAMIRGHRPLIGKIREAFPDDQPNADYPVLMAMLAVDAHLPSADTRLADLEKQDLSNQQLLIVARACARVGRGECVQSQITRLRDPQNMSDGEIAGLGELYLGMGDLTKGGAFIEEMAAKRHSKEIDAVRVRFAAALGNADTVTQWLNANSQLATVPQLRDLYFLAANHGHYALASDLAERLYALEASTEHRSYLSYIYMKSGQYEKAVSLLREAADRSDEDERNYLTALVELATVNPEQRQELTNYAQQHLSGSADDKQKLAILYSLARAKNLQSALPALKEFAEQRGGRWAGDYGMEMIRQGKRDAARDYWLRAARQPGTSQKTKTTLAYNLLNHGFTAEAQSLFFDLAQDAGPDSDQVKRVLYLWGPRPTGEQMEWLVSRYNSAPEGDKAQWANLLLGYSSAETFAETVKRHPELLHDPDIARRHFAALEKEGALEAALDDTLATAQSSGDPELARQYARAAYNAMLRQPAGAAYNAVLEANPKDADALADGGFNAFARADYAESARLLGAYLSLDPSQQLEDKTWRAYFYFGEIMRRQRQWDTAQAFYERAIDEIRARNLESADALTAEAQALVWLDQPQESLITFDKAMELHPDNEVLRLDLVSTLIEMRRYDEARLALTAAPTLQPIAMPQTGGEALAIPETGLKGYQLYGNGSEAILFFTPAKQGTPAFPAGTEKNYPWLAYISDSYDQTLIAAKPGYTLELARDADNTLRLSAKPSAGSGDFAQRQIRLRRELLAARIDLETNHEASAIERLQALLQEYPNDPQLLGYTANALNYSGNWQKASTLLAQARAVSPDNEDLALLASDIHRIHAPEVKLDGEYQRRGPDRLRLATLSGYFAYGDSWEAGAILQDADVRMRGKRRADGRVGNFKGYRERGEIYVARTLDDGNRVKASLFGNNDTPGAGVAFDWLNRYGKSEITAEYHRPYWEFIEGILDDATRDRLAFNHQYRATQKLSLTGGVSLNRYNVEQFNGVANTYGFNASAFYTLLEMDRSIRQPLVALGYGLDAEYGFSRKGLFDGFGNFYRPFPFRNRETHAVSVQTSYLFTDDTRGDLILGYGYDRHGGHGPNVEGRLTQQFNQDWDAQIRAAYGVDNSFSKSNIGRVGGYVRYKLK